MRTNLLKWSMGLVLVGGAAALVILHADGARLRRRIAAARTQNEKAQQLRDDNRRARELIAHAQADSAAGVQAIQADLVQARAEMARLEKRARETSAQVNAQAATDATALATNRDPAQGLTRLDHFRDVGAATPTAAFQTFVWAAIAGADEKLAALIAFPGEGRRHALAIIAGLSDADQAKFPTPEKLAALYFADAFTSMTAAQIVGVAMVDAEHATVRVRGLTAKEQKIPLLLGGNGWQVEMPEAVVGKLKAWAQPTARPSTRS